MWISFRRLPLAKLVTCKPPNHGCHRMCNISIPACNNPAFFHLCLHVWAFYITLGCQTERKCSIMQASSLHKHYFSDVCEASQVKSGSSSLWKHTRCSAKSDAPELIMSRSHISSFLPNAWTISMFKVFKLGTFHNRCCKSPITTPLQQRHLIIKSKKHPFITLTFLLFDQLTWMCSEIVLCISSQAYPTERISLRYPPAEFIWTDFTPLSWSRKRWNKGGSDSRHLKKRRLTLNWITGTKDAIS